LSCDEPFPTASLHLVPGLDAVIAETESREDQLRAGDHVFEGRVEVGQRLRSEIALRSDAEDRTGIGGNGQREATRRRCLSTTRVGVT
jgi:hypothetical protein